MLVDDVCDVFVYLVEQCVDFDFDLDFLVVGGDSVGGYFVVQVVQGMCFGFVNVQLLLYFVIMLVFGSESYNVFVQDFGFMCDEMCWYWEKYIGVEVFVKFFVEYDFCIFLMVCVLVYMLFDIVVIVVVYDVLCDDGL